MSPTDEGDWPVYAQLQVGSTYQYGVLLYQTFEEARKANEGDVIDSVKVRFSRRINGVQV